MGAFRKVTRATGDYLRSFAIEDGINYRHEHQDIGPAIKHVDTIRRKHSYATRASNPNEWRHIGSIPITMITDWCRINGYSFDQWARNEDNAKKKFLKHFMSRDYSKLHNAHVTTKKESSTIVVPEYIRRRHNEQHTRGTEG